VSAGGRNTSSRYHREVFVLEALVDYESRFDDPTREVPNPAGLPDYLAAGTGMMAKPIAIPRARIAAAIITATEMFPFLISSHSSMGVSQSNTRNKIRADRSINHLADGRGFGDAHPGWDEFSDSTGLLRYYHSGSLRMG
jgi:hypothetical protein